MAKENKVLDDQLHWYKDAIIYELHIKAFRDGNCDGIGDFKGLLEKLPYLESLGVTAIWLLPFYPSPLRDDGYDIADYYQINPSYGDIKDFKLFLKEAHRRGLKVITELVINHTSDQHPWFQRARKAKIGSPYRDYYVWTDDPNQFKDARIIFQDYETSNWTYDPVAKQHYWHRFFHHQPDLNYRSELVQKEVFKVLEFWCKLGVDGFRLDAVPYLFEREGTNCENLPETHEFLKKLRKFIDEHYPGTLLLAEANMWPEDSAAYFGDGDECHMNYHFPLMPRMFMALQMEDRYPITDIYDQTPEIPETSQWAIFLRNHDELTLEMVTDEERDYMYKVYVKDPKARINLGIRHRLAPLLENNRKKIELMNSLLFTLPGTPVIYYGDEIGMGDNFYLGDRDGVRTPMQWDSDRNSGFSEANPQRLYLPLVLDPQFHYESVNVELQQRNTSSLLWWMKRQISTRKKYKAFSRGDFQFVQSENAKILAFTRSYEGQTMLVVANLSRFTQPFELALDHFNGFQPTDLLSGNKFPVIKEDVPYFLTLSAYGTQTFLLEKVHPEMENDNRLQTISLKKWSDLLSTSNCEILENRILPDYVIRLRWFGGKGRGLESIKIIEHASLPTDNQPAYILLLEASYRDGLPDLYQLPVAFGDSDFAKKTKDSCPQAVIAMVDLNGQQGILYDAIYGLDIQQAIIEHLANSRTLAQRNTELVFNGSRTLKAHLSKGPQVKPKVLSGEQSNTSITYDNLFYLKIYRKVDRAINPDLEITKFLSTQTKFKNIPGYVGHYSWQFGKQSMVLGMMQEMVQSTSDGWTYMLDKLNQYTEKLLTLEDSKVVANPESDSFTAPMLFEQIPAEQQKLLDGATAELIRLLGTRTAELHLNLADSALPDFEPEEFSLHYQRSLFSSLQTLVRVAFQNLNKNYKRLSPEIQKEADQLLQRKSDILTAFKKVYSHKIDTVKIRIHGDYHLGQVLFTGNDFLILDFEGEPARSYSERRLKYSPLRDVAGMLRSLHYVAYGSLLLDPKSGQENTEKLLPYIEQWYHYMSGFFMQAYLEATAGSKLVPVDRNDLSILMQTYLLQKAIYELNYELNNRPDWVIVPIRGIMAILNMYN